jgi:hypothetical protein
VLFRPASITDLPSCASLLHPGWRTADSIRQRIVSLWSNLLKADSTTFLIMEDMISPQPRTIEGFGASIFVTDAFADALLGRPQPYVAARVYEDLLAGRTPVLSRQAVAEAHAAQGLNLLVLHFGLRNHDLADERTRRTLQAGMASFYFGHAGYRIARVIYEVYGPGHAQYMTAGGFRLQSRFNDLADTTLRGVGPAMWPHLFALEREDMVPGAVHSLSALFHPEVPLLGLSASEQRVVTRALLDEADTKIARELGVTTDTVKKTWSRVYERVSRVSPALLHEGVDHARSGRSTEKRRHLLAYVRAHLEEIRPWGSVCPSPREAGTSAGNAPRRRRSRGSR